jgi:hypothetical protein
MIADNLKKAGFSVGWVSAVDSEGRTIWILDAHCDDENRFVARADEKLTAFLELETAVRLSQRRTQLVMKQGLATQFAPHGSQAE